MNPSKNTIKRIFRADNGPGLCNGWGLRHTDYYMFNKVGASAFHMSKGNICNRGGKGSNKYATKTGKARRRFEWIHRGKFGIMHAEPKISFREWIKNDETP